MNEERLTHHDIPIGESFAIINQNVSGMKVKDGKISLGCALVIADSAGNKLLEEADLFASSASLDESAAPYLQCIVNTGEPIEWERHYTVKATFWDKYGDGKIVNSVIIRAIDIP
jgi:hypothetical protein